VNRHGRRAGDVRSASVTDHGHAESAHSAHACVVSVATRDAHGVLAVVCDGAGAHTSGALSARLAVEVVARRGVRAIGDRACRDVLRDAVQSANRSVHDVVQRRDGATATGTTCTALLLCTGEAYCAHVGDSRVYLARRGALYVMTEDHSAAMQRVHAGTISLREARWHADRRELRRVLGSHHEVEVATWPAAFAVHPGDRFLLCTRGVHDAVPESALQHVLQAMTPQDASQALIDAVRATGAGESLAVAVVAVVER